MWMDVPINKADYKLFEKWNMNSGPVLTENERIWFEASPFMSGTSFMRAITTEYIVKKPVSIPHFLFWNKWSNSKNGNDSIWNGYNDDNATMDACW